MPLFIKEVPKEVGEYVKSHFRYGPESGQLYRTKAYSKAVDTTKPVGSLNSQGYLDVDLSRAHGQRTARNTRVHRVIWFLVHGYWPDFQLDHIDGDKTNNKIENLRPIDQRYNQANRVARTDVTSNYKGVGWHRGKWRAFIMQPGKKYKHLGRFDTQEEAAKAYDKAALELFGDFSRLNFPVDDKPSAVQVH